MSKKITQKIRELLTPEDLSIFESAMENMIEDRVSKKLGKLINLKEEELEKKYDEIAEKYVTEEIEKRMEQEKASLVESYDKKLELLEKKIVSKLGTFLDQVIVEQISDETLTKIAINETLEPVVKGIKKVFGDNHLELDSTAKTQVEKLKSEIKNAKKELSESIEKRMQVENKLEQSAVYLLISEKTHGLKPSDKKRVVETFKNKDFETVEGDIDSYITLIKESSFSTRKPKKTVVSEGKETKSVKEKVNSINEGANVEVKKEKIDTDLDETSTNSLTDFAAKYL